MYEENSGSFSTRGSNRRKGGKKTPEEQEILSLLREQGYASQADRIEGCGRPIEEIDAKTGEVRLTREYCRYRKLCEDCARIQGKKVWPSIRMRLRVAFLCDELDLNDLIVRVPWVREQLDAFVDHWKSKLESWKKKTEYCQTLKPELTRLSKAINTLELKRSPKAKKKRGLDIQKERGLLREAKVLLEDGPLSMKSLLQRVRKVKKQLGPSVDCRHGYKVQQFMVSLRTTKEERKELKSYRERVRQLRKYIKALLNYGALAAHGSGAIVSIHLQNNVHAHILYFGPMIKQKVLRASWCAITKPKEVEAKGGFKKKVKAKGSYKADVNPLLLSEADVEEKLLYLYRLPKQEKVTPEARVLYWKATKKMPLITYHGVLSHPTQAKLRMLLAHELFVDDREEGQLADDRTEPPPPPVRVVDLLRLDDRDWQAPNPLLLQPGRARTLASVVRTALECQPPSSPSFGEFEREGRIILDRLKAIEEGRDPKANWEALKTIVEGERGAMPRKG
jgi:hypothetical protein